MSTTISGVRIVDMPDLGAFDATSSIVGEKSGSGRFSAAALGGYYLPLSGGVLDGPGNLAINGLLTMPGEPTGPTIHLGMLTDTSSAPGNMILVQKTFNIVGGTGAIAPSLMNLQTTILGAPNYFVWPLNVQTTLSTTGSSTGQHVNIASSFFRTSGATPSFLYYGQNIDKTGLPPTATAQSVGFEMDLLQNGPESGAGDTYFNPGKGARAHLTLNARSYAPPVWQPSHAQLAGDVITASPTNGFTYIAQNAGTTGVVQPAFPVSAGTVVDGGVTWTYGTTTYNQVSRVIEISSSLLSEIGAGLSCHGTYYDAVIEMSSAILDTTLNPNAAAIRLKQDFPIDFTGALTAATQNLHTLSWTQADTGFGRFSFQHVGNELLSIGDNGVAIFGNDASTQSIIQIDSAAGVPRQLRFTTANSLRWSFLTGSTAETGSDAGSDMVIYRFNDAGAPVAPVLTFTRATGAISSPPFINAANDAAAASAGVQVGQWYRNGSAMMQRVA